MRTVEELFTEYKGRRSAILRALTTDVDRFFQQCDPERENLCLYGYADGAWAVDLPVEEVPPEIPEPALGINFARDGMQRQDWLALVAVHSDSWLLSLAFYKGARFNREQRCAVHSVVRVAAASLLLSCCTSLHSIAPRNCLSHVDAFQTREELFNMINTLPTCYEVVSGKARAGDTAAPKRRGGNAATGRPPKHAKHVSLIE